MEGYSRKVIKKGCSRKVVQQDMSGKLNRGLRKIVRALGPKVGGRAPLSEKIVGDGFENTLAGGPCLLNLIFRCLIMYWNFSLFDYVLRLFYHLLIIY